MGFDQDTSGLESASILYAFTFVRAVCLGLRDIKSKSQVKSLFSTLAQTGPSCVLFFPCTGGYIKERRVSGAVLYSSAITGQWGWRWGYLELD